MPQLHGELGSLQLHTNAKYPIRIRICAGFARNSDIEYTGVALV